MPAEYEPHAATWLVWPHNPETWPGCLAEAEAEYAELVRALAASEPVHILVQSQRHRDAVARRLPAPARLHIVQSDDSWMRDIGPTFVECAAGGLIALDWTFNSWGGKYPPWSRDDGVAARVAVLAGARQLRPGLVVEGGSLETDGEGTLLATRSSLVDPRRNPGLGQAALEARLAPLLGIERFVWLDAELAGDDTDAHIDNIARFVAPGRVVCAQETRRSDPNHAPLEACWRALGEASDARGRGLERIALPMPAPQTSGGLRLPASHANFYVANRAVLVPTFGGASDREALTVLGALFPGRDAIGISARTLVRGLGTLHCLTQQQPRGH